jgi:hypothetical protein
LKPDPGGWGSRRWSGCGRWRWAPVLVPRS